MSNIVWSADKGWHDGPEASITLDSAGRIRIEVTHVTCPAHAGQSYNKGTGDCSCGSNHHRWASPYNPDGFGSVR